VKLRAADDLGALVIAQKFDVLGIGNAVVDVLAHAEEDFLTGRDLQKGVMRLVDAREADRLYAAMGPGIEASGGSAANTMAGIASLGGRAAFIGKIRNDELGKVFTHDIRALGVSFQTQPAADGAATARCLILVTPDAQRTMNTYLGASADLSPDDIHEETVASADITYLEGYLWDPPKAKAAFRKAIKAASRNNRMIALTLSDPLCVDRWREEFRHLIENDIDILFANENEIMSLYQTRDFDQAFQHVRRKVQIAVLTRSAKGSVVCAGEDVHIIDALAVEHVIDTTGAGDLYAAGFLYALSQRLDLGDCGRLGAMCAAEVISHIGARPETPLRALMDRTFKTSR
jgi:sugar/nucleoside kinase (ribokinase family)